MIQDIQDIQNILERKYGTQINVKQMNGKMVKRHKPVHPANKPACSRQRSDLAASGHLRQP
jgi:hypothetical protein